MNSVKDEIKYNLLDNLWEEFLKQTGYYTCVPVKLEVRDKVCNEVMDTVKNEVRYRFLHI